MCPECKARGKVWQGSDPKCAFPDGSGFSSDNWNCATINRLREMVEMTGGPDARDDNGFGHFMALPVWGDEGRMIVLSFYKDRGHVPIAHWYADDEFGPLTLAIAREAIERCEAALQEEFAGALVPVGDIS